MYDERSAAPLPSVKQMKSAKWSVDWRISSADERERDGSVGFGYEGRARGNWKIARDLARVVPRKRQTLALPGTWWN